jgi:hypothetical protein
MNMFRNGACPSAGRLLGIVAASVAAGIVMSACSGGTPKVASDKVTTTTKPGAKLVGPVAPSTSTTPTTDINVPLTAISDAGPPSQVGEGPLTAPVVKVLMQYFEDNVALAYSTGDAGALEHYLAGSMLTGNRGTINVLNAQNQRNVFKINVQSVSLDNDEKDRVVFDMKGAMVTDYFENTATNQPVANGLPGPSAVDFLVFIDFNPANHTWYWTGEQNLSNSADGSSAGQS